MNWIALLRSLSWAIAYQAGERAGQEGTTYASGCCTLVRT